MTSVERNPVLQTAFTHLFWALSNFQTVYDERRDPGSTDLVEIHSRLLPLLQKQIVDLVSSFKMIDFENGPVPELALFPKVAAFQHTWERTNAAIVSIALRPDQPDFTQDHDCKDFKQFRCSRLMNGFDDLRYFDFGFLECGRELAQGSADDETAPELDSDAIENPQEQEDWQAAKKREMLIRADHCTLAIDDIVQRLKRSDLGLLQEKWQGWIGSPSDACSISYMVSLSFLFDPKPATQKARNTELTPLLRSARALFIVFRVFYKKLSDSSTNKLPFALKDVSSDDMELILWKTKPPPALCEDFLYVIMDVYYQDDIDPFQQGIFRRIAVVLRAEFQKTLDCLKSYLIPLPPDQPGHSDPPFDVDTYFLCVKDQLHATLDNLVRISNALRPVDEVG
ncbi:hypothetical protein PTTG_03951 [Puccinia triticina 1-1 BBBD Race 1]|uniref:Uncharacterized protein n=2 Tax=Puccinia triticina TaxID=208348 RepID=A0A180GCL5_PUCT1|nr:uncharacterized protein PtA15_5A797 [Puccinia triticina]OAV90437.1 hypothetical protein PTTG_03951 [Puccinia triticina 1-1 BBBD Race 1]WAQ85223.1 hypothetical protein PtA15_5A797 [Puccinia triticina]WAR58548.1 hypothetical protein PtB15_5B782 [Puccinia triticina]